MSDRADDRAAAPPAVVNRWRAKGPLLMLVVVTLAVAAAVLRFPTQPLALGLGLLVAAALVTWRPLLLWWLVPAALPVLDLVPWSGRHFLDEFDLLLAMLLAVAWWRSPPPAPDQGQGVGADRPLQAALWLVGLSYALSALRALLPWPGAGADALANLQGPFNALLVARGAGWALLLWALARRQRAAGGAVAAAFGNGLVLGLLGAVLCVVAERFSFTQWWQVTDGYRVAGPFSAMHTGGAYVEAFLVSTLPFLVARLWPPVPAGRLVAGGALLVAAMYAVMVTFSRGGYIAFVLSLALLVVLTARQRGGRGQSLLAGLVLAAVAAGVAWPVLMGPFAQSRLASIDRDRLTREDHWARTLAMIDRDPATLLLGMGVGQFPAVGLLRSPPAQRSASYRLMDDAGRRFLRLGTGHAVYIEQFVDTLPGQTYTLQLRLRASAPGAALGISLCEKWLIASAACSGTSINAGTGTGEWLTLTQSLDSDAVGADQPGPRRPVVLSFHIAGAVPMDLASIQLSTASGQPLLRNPGFADGLDHWFFTSDKHLAWHAHSMPLAVFFDQGALGLLAMTGLLALALARAGRSAWRGQPGAAALLAALAAFATVGVVDTLIDAPRFLMLWLLLCCFAADARRPTAGS